MSLTVSKQIGIVDWGGGAGSREGVLDGQMDLSLYFFLSPQQIHTFVQLSGKVPADCCYSGGGWEDEEAWAALWLYQATGKVRDKRGVGLHDGTTHG